MTKMKVISSIDSLTENMHRYKVQSDISYERDTAYFTRKTRPIIAFNGINLTIKNNSAFIFESQTFLVNISTKVDQYIYDIITLLKENGNYF